MVHIKKAIIQLGKAIIASLFFWLVGGICVLFCLGAARSFESLLLRDIVTAQRLINEWTIPTLIGGVLGSLFGIVLYEKIRSRSKEGKNK